MSVTFSAKFDGLTGAPRVAREVGKYQVLAELGRGGMANVYLAALRGKGAVNKLVVLKALLPEIASEPDSLAMFLDEARLAALLNHGNVVQTYEVGTEGDRHVIVMEYLEGQSLASVLRKAAREGQRLPFELHLRVLIDALEGLHYAHELKGYDGKPLQLVHRDVSPQNVFITYDGRTKLLDFGIAKAAISTTHTATGVLKGKIAYMAPEQLSGDDADRRADVYALGCMLWAAATGRKLWKDVPDTRILRRVLDGDVPSPQSVNPSCDDDLARIVQRAMATDPAQRYATARELQDELEGYAARHAPVGKPRELATFVSTLFADAQIELNARIEQALARFGEVSSPPSGDTTRSLALDVAESRQTVSSTQTISASAVNHTESRAPQKRTRWWAAAAVIGLALSGYAIASRSPATTNGAAPITSLTAPREPIPEVKPSSVRIELRAAPSDARLYLDGEPMPGNPALRVLPSDAKVHQLRAELAGYQTASAEFTAMRDDVVELRLDALKATAGANSAPARRSLPATRKPNPAKPSCAQPFFVDSDGIKKVRPECL
jgi:serine/threonine-protein kinase